MATPPSSSRLDALRAAPRRSPLLHWAAFGAALLALLLLVAWLLQPGPLPSSWALADGALSVAFLAEFFTRSGFRWAPARYTASRFFDFVAMLPLALFVSVVGPVPNLWWGLLLAARAARVVDRALGDGFVRRNVLALVEAFEEEITDRVMVRILDRVEGDLQRSGFGRTVAKGLAANRDPVLDRIHRATLQEGLASDLAHATGLDAALRKAEERAYDAVVEILSSPEVDRTLRDVLASSFASLRAEVAEKAWKQKLGVHPRAADKKA